MTRAARQERVALWCRAAFGDKHLLSKEMSGLRLAEESIEAAQACGVDAATLHKLVDHIYGKPAGAIEQELGGVGITLLALCSCCGLDADEMEQKELDRIMAMPLEYFSARNKAKISQGFAPKGDPKDES